MIASTNQAIGIFQRIKHGFLNSNTPQRLTMGTSRYSTNKQRLEANRIRHAKDTGDRLKECSSRCDGIDPRYNHQNVSYQISPVRTLPVGPWSSPLKDCSEQLYNIWSESDHFNRAGFMYFTDNRRLY